MKYAKPTGLGRMGASVLLLVVLPCGRAAWAAKPNQRLSDDARGTELYERHCVQCHGDSGAGDGPVATSLTAAVPDLRGRVDPDDLAAQADVVMLGRGLMPGFSLSFNAFDARRVLRRMAALSVAAAAPPDTRVGSPAVADPGAP